MTITYDTINERKHATKYPVLNLDMTMTIYCHCPNCKEMFKEAPRCPWCGQLVQEPIR